MAQVSAYAESKGIDSFEEDNDLEFDDEDENLIHTPYEYKEMTMEFPIEEADNVEGKKSMAVHKEDKNEHPGQTRS